MAFGKSDESMVALLAEIRGLRQDVQDLQICTVFSGLVSDVKGRPTEALDVLAFELRKRLLGD